MLKITVHKIIRSRRRTIALMVTPEATLVIRAPLWTPRWHIDKFIHQERAWIAKKLREIQSRPQAVKHEFLAGEAFLYLGKRYRLRYSDVSTISLDEWLTVPNARRPHVRESLTAWYQSQAARMIHSRVRLFTQKMGVVPTRVKISKAQTRWGSCGHGDSINLNWRLVMAPLAVLDYVVVHELAHVDHKHHGTRFWEAVAQILPDYRRSRTWIKANGHLLKI